jgi:ubiquitin-activating enzyme E1
LGSNLGLYGNAFIDFGNNYKCFDKTGEDNKNALVVNITKEKDGIVTVHEDKRHPFIDGDTVTFREVQGMT